MEIYVGFKSENYRLIIISNKYGKWMTQKARTSILKSAYNDKNLAPNEISVK